MNLTIPDDLAASAHLDEQSLLIELACRLFDSSQLTLGQAMRFARLSRTEFEEELMRRSISVYRLDINDLRSDLAAQNFSPDA
jgi:predicted HTH domain antitoxin